MSRITGSSRDVAVKILVITLYVAIDCIVFVGTIRCEIMSVVPAQNLIYNEGYVKKANLLSTMLIPWSKIIIKVWKTVRNV